MRRKVMAAAPLFAARGADATTMEDLAAATAIPRATLYYYFASKEDILACIFEELLAQVRHAVLLAIAGEGRAAERLEALIAAHLDVFARYPMASRVLQLDLGRAARISEIAARIDAAFITPVTTLLKQGAADGSLLPVRDPRLTAFAILGAITTTGTNALTVESNRAVRDVAAAVTSLVLDGIRS